MQGKIHSYLTMSAIDGPGLRFILFLQGCRLRCVYCHNPDTWIYENGKSITPEAIVEEISKSLHFYTTSGGGVTLSGGEPLFQPDFTSEILRLCKNINIHTAVDTSGAEDLSLYPEIVKNTDLFILDIKAVHMDTYTKITSDTVGNHLKNGEYLSSLNKKMWIRYVLVPGYNDSERDISALIDYLKKLKTIERVIIVPYSKLGEHKWDECGLNNVLKTTEPPSAELINSIKERIIKSEINFSLF